MDRELVLQKGKEVIEAGNHFADLLNAFNDATDEFANEIYEAVEAGDVEIIALHDAFIALEDKMDM